MALGQRRMINTSIWQNTGFAMLHDKAKLLYMGTITFADDDGRLRANSLLLKSQVFPFDEEITQLHVRKWLNIIAKTDLIEVYKVGNEYFIQHPHWEKYQSIRKDLYKPSNLPQNPSRKSNEAVTKSHPNISKDNISKEREAHHSMEYLKNLPTQDLFEFYKRFDCSKKALISKGEDLYNYCKAKGKRYSDYRAMLLNALKKDFQERRHDDKIRNSKLMEVDGVMKIVPFELQKGIEELHKKMKVGKLPGDENK